MMLMLSKTGLGSWAHMNLRRSENQGERSRFSDRCPGGHGSTFCHLRFLPRNEELKGGFLSP